MTSRRALLGMMPALALAGCSAEKQEQPQSAVSAFYGRHQAGITTPQQSFLHLLAMDLVEGADRRAVARTLEAWTGAAAALTAGRSKEPEVAGLEAARLTVTFGMGKRLVPELKDLPSFPGDRLDAKRCGGDLILQLCADDPVLPVQAALLFGRLADGVARPRWRQAGVRHTRNLFGFKDGIANPTGQELERDVWTPEGGTFMVVRRIHMDTQGFSRLSVAEQEATVGRRRVSGTPLGAGAEIDLFAKVATGAYVIPVSAHVRRANPLAVGGTRMLRRGYSYVDGSGDQGLAFVSFQNTLETFVNVQRRLASDAMMAHTTAVGSAVFYLPPGAQPGQTVGADVLHS